MFRNASINIQKMFTNTLPGEKEEELTSWAKETAERVSRKYAR